MEPLTWTRASVRSRRIASSSLKRITKTERGREKRQRDSKKRFKVTGHHLEATQNCCFVPSCCSLSTIDDQNRLDFFLLPRHELQKDAIAIFYFPCHGWKEIGLVIVRFSLAKACHRNNIMVEIMTSKLGCHKAIDAPFSFKTGSQSKLDLQVTLK